MKRGGLLAIAVVAALLVGCGTSAILPKNFSGPSPDESVIVLGVKPDGARLHIHEGSLAPGGVTVRRGIGTAVINGVAQDGYLIAKAKAGQLLVVSQVFPRFGRSFNACAGTRSLAFEVPAGQVVYVSDLEFGERDNQLWVRYVDRFAEAKAHVRTNYPRLAQDLQLLASQRLAVDTPCPPGTVFLVPTPAKETSRLSGGG
jgi:hypothetical protein